MQTKTSRVQEKIIITIAVIGYAALCISVYKDMATSSSNHFPVLAAVLLVAAGATRWCYEKWFGMNSRRSS